jgi:ATP-dependent Lon protease
MTYQRTVDKMLREEEDDITQEMRQMIMLKTKEEVDKYINKIEAAKIPATDEWTDGLVTGMEWAIRILRGDKSAS